MEVGQYINLGGEPKLVLYMGRLFTVYTNEDGLIGFLEADVQVKPINCPPAVKVGKYLVTAKGKIFHTTQYREVKEDISHLIGWLIRA